MVFVTGIGLVTALGPTAAVSWSRLLGGNSGIQLRQPFADLSVRPLAMVGKHPAELSDILSQAVSEALKDAGLTPPLPDCGVVIGSSRSFQGAWERAGQEWLDHGQLPAGADWLMTLPHMGAIATARQIGATGAVLAPMAACATGLTAIFQGYELIRRGHCHQVIAGAGEAPITPLTLAGFERLGALANTGCYPFDPFREGLVLGEGAAVLVLESAASLVQRPSVQPYGRILGAGLSANAYHRTAPDPGQRGSRLALAACLRHSGLTPGAIGYVHTHGTGTALNDAHEAILLSEALPQPAASSTKGATGHTLGASGAIGAALTLLALRDQTLPPNVGWRGKSIYPALVTEATALAFDTALCVSFGFGGQNAVLALGR
ncbi:MAG: beta-ketoacyl-ACP synthase [Nodosilinea sp.]